MYEKAFLSPLHWKKNQWIKRLISWIIISLNGRLKYSLSEDFQGSVFKKLEQPWSETLTKCNNFNEKYQQFQSNLNNFKKENVYAIRA